MSIPSETGKTNGELGNGGASSPLVPGTVRIEGGGDGAGAVAPGDGSEGSSKGSFNIKKFRTAFLHIALLITCGGYIMLGAAICVHLERPYEIAERERTIAWNEGMIEMLLANASKAHSAAAFERALDEYTKGLFEIFDTHHGGHIFDTHYVNPTEDKDMWTFSSAVLFTATTVIPVGYGYVTPISPISKVFVILYGLIGIPLVLVTMADAGKFLSNFITQFFETSLTIPTIIFVSVLAIYPVIGGVFFRLTTDMSMLDSIYFSFISIFTIGFGDLAPSVNVFYLVLFIVLGVILVTITIDFVAAELINHVHYMGRHVGRAKELAGKMLSLAQSLNMNRGLTVGMSQLHALARFGMLGKIDENALKAPRVHVAFEPSLDDMDFMDCGASRDVRASRLSLYNI